MPIHTVSGPIEADELGPTTMHEHVFTDLRLWAKDGPDGVAWEGPIGPEAQAHLRWNGLHTPANLVLDDADVAVEELTSVHAAGGRLLAEWLGGALTDPVAGSATSATSRVAAG